MDDDELIDEVAASLGLSSITPFRAGGQKLVCEGQLANANVIIKIIRVPDGPAGVELSARR